MKRREIYIPAGIWAALYNVLEDGENTEMLAFHDIVLLSTLFEKYYFGTESSKKQGYVANFYSMPHWPDIEGNPENKQDFFKHQIWLRKYVNRYNDTSEAGTSGNWYKLYLQIYTEEYNGFRGDYAKTSRLNIAFERIKYLLKNYKDSFFKQDFVEGKKLPDNDTYQTLSNMYVFNSLSNEQKKAELKNVMSHLKTYIESGRHKCLTSGANNDFDFDYSESDFIFAMKKAVTEFKANNFHKISNSKVDVAKSFLNSETGFAID